MDDDEEQGQNFAESDLEKEFTQIKDVLFSENNKGNVFVKGEIDGTSFIQIKNNDPIEFENSLLIFLDPATGYYNSFAIIAYNGEIPIETFFYHIPDENMMLFSVRDEYVQIDYENTSERYTTKIYGKGRYSVNGAYSYTFDNIEAEKLPKYSGNTGAVTALISGYITAY